MAKKSTIKDIADSLGVSKALVSFVLNGKSKEKRISDEMTAKVLKMAKKLNYKPNYLAKSLRTGKSHTLALIIADISNPFFAKFARHIEIEASKYDYKVIFANSDEQKDKFASELSVLKNRQVDGFILIPPIGSEDDLMALQKDKIPFVVVDRQFKNVNSHTIIIDNFTAGFEATNRLIQNNRKNIAILNVNNQLFTMKQRVKGYRSALRDNNLQINTALIKQLKFSHDRMKVRRAIEEIIQEGADGILFTTSKLAILGFEFLLEMGVKIPEDVAIISFDDMDAYSITSTPISAVIQPIEKMSSDAIRILTNMIDGNYKKNEVENITHRVDFIFRASCK